MTDFTKDSIVRHIVTTAAPIAMSMLAYIAYQLVDLYFITKIGAAATAGVNAAGNVAFIVNALCEVLVVGTVAPIAQAIGRRDYADANAVFNQALALSVLCGLVMAVLMYGSVRSYMDAIAADAATAEAGASFVRWTLPGFALSLPMAVFSSALRGEGMVKPAVAAYLLTVVLNAALAPVLIVGWGTGAPLGVMGAGLATTISVAIGAAFLAVRFHRLQLRMSIGADLLRPSLRQWRRILAIGLPAGAELVLMFMSTAVVYYAIRDLGASSQAGFGIGSRLLQAILLPALIIALAAAPIAGQNFGARNDERVRVTFHKTALLTMGSMAAATFAVQWWAGALVGMFDADGPAVVAAESFLKMLSWTFVAQAFVFTCSTMFQGLGNTVPALISSAMRFACFAGPAVWLSGRTHLRIEDIWCLWIVSVLLQALASLGLLRIEFRRKLAPIQDAPRVSPI